MVLKKKIGKETVKQTNILQFPRKPVCFKFIFKTIILKQLDLLSKI